MFSYRHAFHAGNHADVLKHTVLIATLRHMLEKDTGLMVIDTHAGAGVYQLDDRYAKTSGEASEGYHKLKNAPKGELSKPVLDYVQTIESFAVEGNHEAYPGSPFILAKLLREHDKLKLFELHPTDSELLTKNVGQLRMGRKVVSFKEDGFAGVKRFFPPPTRRGLVLCDPSYELRDDYNFVVDMLSDSLRRFATGTYVIWMPILARRESQDLPRKLQKVCESAKREFLYSSLQIKDFPKSGQPSALGASAVFIVNPPHTLKASLQIALPQIAEILAIDGAASWALS